MVFYDTRMEPSKRPREEYYAWSWRIQIDLHPEQWIAAQGWSGEDTVA